MTPEQEAKIDNMHTVVTRMETKMDMHLEGHPKQPCSDVKEVKRDVLKALAMAVVALLGVIAGFFGLGK